jgi:ubiquinone/menaquinone biosynthesis C-methylase UbiE
MSNRISMIKPLPRARDAPELLDEPDHDPAELADSLDDVARVNRLLGGQRALLAHVAPLLLPNRTTRILDVGTGSADLPCAVVDWARRQHRSVHITATDLHPQTLDIARSRCSGYPEIAVEPADALKLQFGDGAFDAATLSLTLHHFEQDDQVEVMRELARVANGLVIVNELRRTRINYVGARLLAATIWRGNRLTRHDGPLSVLRAFTDDELLRIAQLAGLHGRVCRHYFQRVVMVTHAR